MTKKLIDTNYIVYDAHACPPFNSDKDLSGLKRYKNAGVTFASINVGYGDMTSNEIIPILKRLQHFISENPQDYRLVKTVADIDDCKYSKKLGIAFDLEGANTLSNKIEMLDWYKELGVRQLLIAYNINNSAGGGCQDIDHGLTKFGKAIIKRMNNIGMLIDCSHTGYRTTLDVMELSSKPVVFSHSNAFTLCNHPRNITDKQIKACAETGGVIGINGISIFLGSKTPTISRFIEHIDYVIELVGPHHVGLGLDYVLNQDEIKSQVKNNPHLFPTIGKYNEVKLLAPEKIPKIYIALQKKGYKEVDIRAILGENFLRVAKQAWH